MARSTRFRLVLPLLFVLAPRPNGLSAQSSTTTFDLAVPPGGNYDKAEFRLWLPNDARTLQGVVVLMPGSNGDGRAQVVDTVWQAFAVRNQLALIGCRFTDQPHDQGFIEDYVDVTRGSGQALLDVLARFATTAKRPELAGAPLLLWGMSAGGEFNYEFTNWKPERVIAFVVNKGGIYYTALTSRAARNVPGILFTGEKDLESRISTITGLFAVNRRGAALWALAEEPGAGHIVGRSRDLALIFFADVLALRVRGTTAAPDGQRALRPLAERDGFLGDIRLKTFQPMADLPVPANPTAWLPTARVARAWQALVAGTPFD
jgi:poly(3-hydroxybutyrate) depolymerase